jgi:hypothetical protein
LGHDQSSLSQTSTITLAKDFFDELVERPVPVDFRALQALRRSPLQMDLYVWLTYRFSYLKRPTLVPWALLKQQFGADYAEGGQGTRNFKKKFVQAMRVVCALYREAKVEAQEEGVFLRPSPTHIKSKHKREEK